MELGELTVINFNAQSRPVVWGRKMFSSMYMKKIIMVGLDMYNQLGPRVVKCCMF